MATPNDELRERLNKRRQAAGESGLSGKNWYKGAPPPAPAYPELVTAKPHGLKIKWEPPAFPVAEESKTSSIPVKVPAEHIFKVEYGFKYTLSSGWTVAADNVRQPKYTITGLEPNTTYVARVSAKYVEGGDWGVPSASSWGMATLVEATASSDDKEAALKKSEDMALKRKARREEERRQAAEKRAEQQARRTAELERSLKAAETAAESERLMRAHLEKERSLAKQAAEERAKEAARLQQQLDETAELQRDAAERAAKAAAQERQRREEALEWKAKAEQAATRRERDAAMLEIRLAELEAARTKAEEDYNHKMEEEGKKTASEVAALKAQKEAEAAALKAEQEALRREVEALAAAKAEAEAAAHKRAEEEAAKLAAASLKLKEENAKAIALQEQQVRQLEEKLSEINLEKAALSEEASSKLAAVAARKEEAEELVRWQAQQAEREVQEKDSQLAAMKQQLARFQEQLEEAKAAAEASTKTAEACTTTIVMQAEENECLKRMAKFKDATIRSLQGAGPNPALESRLVKKGYSRENVRFFIEVYGADDKPKLEDLLSRMRTFAAEGYPDDAIREALTVCAHESSVEGYLKAFVARHHRKYSMDHHDDDEV